MRTAEPELWYSATKVTEILWLTVREAAATGDGERNVGGQENRLSPHSGRHV